MQAWVSNFQVGLSYCINKQGQTTIFLPHPICSNFRESKGFYTIR